MILEDQIEEAERKVSGYTRGNSTIAGSSLEKAKENLQNLYDLRAQIVKALSQGDITSFLKETKKNRQGGLSDAIIETETMKHYILQTHGSLGGYFAKEYKKYRTKEIDTLLGTGLLKEGLSHEQIAMFLCSQFDSEKCIRYVSSLKKPRYGFDSAVDKRHREALIEDALKDIAAVVKPVL